jgi:hypothetical protein
MKRKPLRVGCALCRQTKIDSEARQHADMKHIFTLRSDLLEAEKKLIIVRLALADMVAYYDQVAASKGDWTVKTVERIRQIRTYVTTVQM